jgi:Carboxypeptidase regulatory-like domain
VTGPCEIRPWKSILLFLFLLAFALPSFSAQTAATTSDGGSASDSSTGSVTGIVVRQSDGTPIRRAVVRLADSQDPNQGTSIVTGDNGSFLVSNVPTGRYRMSASKQGFVSQEYGESEDGGSFALLAVSGGKSVSNLVFKLRATATITGHVRDDNGEPLGLVTVSAFGIAYDQGKKTLIPEKQTRTNDLGEYRLFNLKPGRYVVVADPNQVSPDSRRSKQNEYTVLSYQSEFYPGTSDVSRAEAVPVVSGGEISGIDMRLSPHGVVSVRGVVSNSLQPNAVGEISVSLLPKNYVGRWDSNALQVMARPGNGSFEIPNVPEGQYIALAQWQNEGKFYSARRPIEVSDSAIDGVNLTIAAGQSLRGRISWAGGNDPGGSDLRAALLPSEEGEFATSEASVRGDGSFGFENVSEGQYQVVVTGLTKNCYVKEVRSELEANSVKKLSVSQGTTRFEVVLSAQGGQLEGQVLNKDSLVAAGKWVVLVPEAKLRGYDWLFRSLTTDQNGRFAIHAIPPGKYKVFSWDEVEQGAWEDAEFLRPFEDKGQEIEVKESAQLKVDVSSIPASEQGGTQAQADAGTMQ